MLREVSQAPKDKYCMISLECKNKIKLETCGVQIYINSALHHKIPPRSALPEPQFLPLSQGVVAPG